ncbi:fumarylacetoacetate hydrolase family protein [Mycobacterium deserti]|uniref:Fumarylacetoacetate hydrolase family protein n=1 Tax=Mycobacterium deserti TaxID=2978347 RepID=A0ABT2M6F2_9MYCO|nr:fumarylacetoacetate hydrolase family protein [Mycobacterium deserti]MCT7657843.1 fumarylacetoacetate hydrolase family protein [Mycobacterium deserti]
MRLVRVGPAGEERPGVLVGDDSYVDVSDRFTDYDGEFFAGGGLSELARTLSDYDRSQPLDGIRIGPPIARPHQILCVGLNYAEHAAESGSTVTTEPVIFTKAPNSMSGPFDPVVSPVGGTKLDYEVELGVVIGVRSSHLRDDASAAAAIAGFVAVNDVSERAFQLEREGQWVKGKSCPTFNPCGPVLATPDEVGDWQDLELWLTVNGEKRQSSSTRFMVHDVIAIVRYLSQFMVLEPGDLINTGTPAGVALGRADGSYLNRGDVIELGITGLGTQRTVVV